MEAEMMHAASAVLAESAINTFNGNVALALAACCHLLSSYCCYFCLLQIKRPLCVCDLPHIFTPFKCQFFISFSHMTVFVCVRVCWCWCC